MSSAFGSGRRIGCTALPLAPMTNWSVMTTCSIRYPPSVGRSGNHLSEDGALNVRLLAGAVREQLVCSTAHPGTSSPWRALVSSSVAIRLTPIRARSSSRSRVTPDTASTTSPVR